MSDKNKHGLSRKIPAEIRRQVRRQSGFGCVHCRCGVVVYEHIAPTFADAKSHDSSKICCLCAGCHDLVTRGQLAKTTIAADYARIRRSPQTAPRPAGVIDFTSGCELVIGGQGFSPAVHTLLRSSGRDMIRPHPPARGEPASLSATFADEAGDVLFRIEKNEWFGGPTVGDIEVGGNRITVKGPAGRLLLVMRLDPPSRVVVERVDMRLGTAHLLATESLYLAGRHVTDDLVVWSYADIRVARTAANGCAIEFADAFALELRDRNRVVDGVQELADAGRSIVMNARLGVLNKPLGIVLGGGCNGFALAHYAGGARALSEARRVLPTLRTPESLCEYVSGGSP